jgi:RNA polymerase sigma factor (sigma-70 family)
MTNRSLVMGWRERWNRTLLQFLKQRVRTPVDIEDLAQETYLRLLRARDLRDVHNPLAYLLRIAGHVIAEWRDQQAPSDVRVEDDVDVLVDGHTPEFDLDAHISQERLNQALAQVSAMMRAVLLLRLRDERPYREIARELGITERQVKRYLARGYECLRRTLED